ncbi:D-inositol-3-phosphate glycosyltransferase [uncultured archaeon]|nr:D-inositol-3-phosphate glycosyltransferase [uncultured archaeon]
MLGLYSKDLEPTSGQPRAVQNLCRGINARPGNEIHVLSYDDGPESLDEEVIVEDGITYHFVHMGALRPFMLKYRNARRRMTDKIKSLEPDVIHAHIPLFTEAFPSLGIPTVMTVHSALDITGEYFGTFMTREFFRAQFRSSLRSVRHIIAVSPYVEEMLGSRTDGAFHLIPNPVDIPKIVRRKDKEGRLLNVGTIIPYKNQLDAIKTVKELTSDYPDVRLHIAGEVPSSRPKYFRDLTRYVRDNNLEENVVFRGCLKEEELMREYDECCALVHTSRKETACYAILEAMAYGKATVAAKNTKSLEYMMDDGKNGLLSDPDPKELAKKMGMLLGDRKLRGRIGKTARAKIQKENNPLHVAEQTLSLYRRAIDERCSV